MPIEDPYDKWRNSGTDLYRLLPFPGGNESVDGVDVERETAKRRCVSYHLAVNWLRHDWPGISRELEIPDDVSIIGERDQVKLPYYRRTTERGPSLSLLEALSETDDRPEFAAWVFEVLLRRLFKLRLLGFPCHGMLRPGCFRFMPNGGRDDAPSRSSGRLILSDATLKTLLPPAGTDAFETWLPSSTALVPGRMFFAPDARAGTEPDALQTGDIYSTAMLTWLCFGIMEESALSRGPDDPRELLMAQPCEIPQFDGRDLGDLPGQMTVTKLSRMLQREPSRRPRSFLDLLCAAPEENRATESGSLSHRLDELILTFGREKSFGAIEAQASIFACALDRSASSRTERAAAEGLRVAGDYVSPYRVWNTLRLRPRGHERLGAVVDAVLEAAQESNRGAPNARFLALACCCVAVTHMARGRPRTATRVIDQAQQLAEGGDVDDVGHMFGMLLLVLELDFVLESGSYHDRMTFYRKLRTSLSSPRWSRWLSSATGLDPKLLEFLWSVACEELEPGGGPGLLQGEYFVAETFDLHTSWLLKHLVRAAIRFSRRIDVLRNLKKDKKLYTDFGTSGLVDPMPRFELEALGVKERDLGRRPKSILRGHSPVLAEWRSLRLWLRQRVPPEAAECGELLIHGTLVARRLAKDANPEINAWYQRWADLQLEEVLGPRRPDPSETTDADETSTAPWDSVSANGNNPYRLDQESAAVGRQLFTRDQLEDRLVELMDSYMGLYACLAYGKPGSVELLDVSHFRAKGESRTPSASHRAVRQLCHANVATAGRAVFPNSADPRYAIVIHIRDTSRGESISLGVSGEPLRMYSTNEHRGFVKSAGRLIRATSNRRDR